MKKQANDKKGQIITFYSYKGGTGRSMALANTACLLLRDGHRVLMIDWDMEAPGLPKYFRPFLPTSNHQRGLIDFMEMANEHLPSMEYDAEDEDRLEKVFEKLDDYLTPVRNIPEAKGELFLLKSGDESAENYPVQISHFDWEKFFYKIRGFFAHFARYLSQKFDYVLIDSRTGHTDTGGICTMMMPEKLVLVFTPNRQSYDGIANLARKAANYRRRSDDMRPLVIYPLPSRIELGEEDLRQEFLANYRDDFRALLQEIYNVPELNFDNYMENIQIRHSSKFAYQERIAVLEEKIWDRDSLSRVYRNFTDVLESKEMFWQVQIRAMDNPNAIKVFITYARKDTLYRDELLKFLRPLELTGKISFGSKNIIRPGEEWSKSLEDNLKNSDLILMLVSADFYASNYIQDREVKLAVTRSGQNETRILPIIVRPVDWESDPILRSFQVLPKGGRAVAAWPSSDDAWDDVVQSIKIVVDEIAKTRTRTRKVK